MSAFNREKWGAFLWETYRKEINSMVDDGYPEPDWNGVDHERQLAFRIAAETLACALAAADDNVAGRSDGYHTFAELAAVKAESLRYAHLLNEMARDLEKSRVQVAELKWEMGYVQEDAQDAWDRVISLVQERWAAGVKAERDEAMKGGSRG